MMGKAIKTHKHHSLVLSYVPYTRKFKSQTMYGHGFKLANVHVIVVPAIIVSTVYGSSSQ